MIVPRVTAEHRGRIAIESTMQNWSSYRGSRLGQVAMISWEWGLGPGWCLRFSGGSFVPGGSSRASTSERGIIVGKNDMKMPLQKNSYPIERRSTRPQ